MALCLDLNPLNKYCQPGAVMTDCCLASGIGKTQDELYLQLVKGQKNPGADKGNTEY